MIYDDRPGGVAARTLAVEDDPDEFVPMEEEAAPGATLPAFALLSDLLERPEMLAPPAELVPRLVWKARATLLVALAKAGKSTVGAVATAKLSRGAWFLGDRVAKGRVIVVAPDEHTGDTVRRLHELGADGSRVRILVLRPPDLVESLRAMHEEWPADLVVIDSLAESARMMLGKAPEDGDTAGWGVVVRPLVNLAHDLGFGLLTLHHARRSDGEMRGAEEIAASFDAILTMREGHPDEDPTLRRITGRARWTIEPYSLRMEDGEYVLGGGGPVSLDARVVTDVATNPGTSRAESFDRIKGRKASHVAAVGRLVEAGTVVDRGGSLFLADQVEEAVL